MKATDLRIGNLVFDDQNEICSVSKLLSQKKISFEGNGVEDWEVEFKDEKADNIYLSCVINPIPLTAEWLKKFGFEQETGVMAYEKEGVTIVYETVADFYRFYPRTNKIEYIHQLQNLYYALTGKELEI